MCLGQALLHLISLKNKTQSSNKGCPTVVRLCHPAAQSVTAIVKLQELATTAQMERLHELVEPHVMVYWHVQHVKDCALAH